MKGISTTLVIIVTAIVILVAALVVLTIFGGGMQPIVDMTQGRNICLQQVAQSCSLTGDVPPTWNVPTMNVRINNQVVAMPCSSPDLANCHDCVGCGIIPPI
jgi:hypothetical protein